MIHSNTFSSPSPTSGTEKKALPSSSPPALLFFHPCNAGNGSEVSAGRVN